MKDQLRFVKMQGAGNDYVYVDAIAQDLSVERAEALATRLADRHFGVGGDGLILLAPSGVADVRMVMWNADGSRAAMCGNGLRCVAKLAHDEGHAPGPRLSVETDSGVFDATLLTDAEGAVVGARVPMPSASVEDSPRVAVIDGQPWSYHAGDTGNVHAVVFVDRDPEDLPVERVGEAFQRLPEFPNGVNVEFVRTEPPRTLHQRTFERGAGETLACGTGATTAALAALRTSRLPGPEVDVHLRGGMLRIRRAADGTIEMEGPAVTVFRGEVEA